MNDESRLNFGNSPYQGFAKEIKKLNEQIEELKKERLGLKQQCRAAIQQWDKTLRENNETKDQLIQMQQQRNSAVHEYNLIMSERDSVHKEMEKLSEELGQCQKKIQLLDGEKKTLLEDVENLKKEIMSGKTKAIDKELLIKKMYKDKYNDTNFNFTQYGIKPMTSHNHNKWSSSSSGFSSYWTNGMPYGAYNNLKNSLSPASIFNPMDKKQFSMSNSSSTMGNKSKIEFTDSEIELRKQIQTLELDYNNISIELQNCVLQNKKVVQERESIKTLCDKLRRERDRAIRDRAEAIQDLNDFRLKIESNAQLKKYMDNLNEMNLDQNKSKQTNNASNDSAISADITPQEAVPSGFEKTSVLLTNNFRHNTNKYQNPWGFSIRSEEKNIIVSAINMNSPADAKLKLNDIILSINSINVAGDESLCTELLCKLDKDLRLVIQRKKQCNSIINIDLDCSKSEHGIILENVFLIKKVLPNCEAAKNENISIGDRIMAINGTKLENLTIHDVVQLLRENKLVLNIYKQNMNNQNTSNSILINQNRFEHNILFNHLDNDNQTISKFSNNYNKLLYQKDDLNLTNSSKSNYSPKIGHYQSIKRSSKKSKILSNDSSSSFGTEYDKNSPTLLNKTFNLFKKSNKTKSEKKEEKMKKNSSENATLENFNKILNNFSKRDSKTKSVIDKSLNDKNSIGTWPSYKSNTNLPSSPTYGKINPMPTYSKRKERKSLAIFMNYSKNDYGKSNYAFENSKDCARDKSINEFSKEYKNLNDFQQYCSPVLDNSYKSFLYNQDKNNEHNNLSTSYSSKDNFCKLNNSKKYTLNHEIAYKSFNAPSSSLSIQMDQDYQMKKSKEKKYLDAHQKENKEINFHSPDLLDEKSSKDTLFHLSNNLDSSIGFYSNTNKRQLITNMTPNYSQDLESYLNNNSSFDQGLQDSNGQIADLETNNTINPYFLSSNINNQKKPSPININQLKALNQLSITPSPSYHLNDNLLFSNSPSHYATLSSNNNSQHSKDYYNLNKQNTYDRANIANVSDNINQTSPSHQSNNIVESVSSLSWNINQQDAFPFNNKNQRLYISSNNSVASKLSNCSMDSNSIPSNAINLSSNYFKKGATNESLDSASYTNIQNLRTHVDLLNRTKDLSLDNKLTASKIQQNFIKKAIESKIVANNSLEISSSYSSVDENPKTGEIRTIFIEKSKEKSLGIQIECGNNGQINTPGIFVSCVNEGSLAKKVGLKVGDQLLEICGINMRSANKDAAANVLRQCGQTVIMKVQYNPDKFFNKDHLDQKLNKFNNQTKVEEQINLGRQEDDEKNDLENTVKNFQINTRKEQVSCETINKDDTYSIEKFFCF